MTLLCIHSYPSAVERIHMLWPYYEITGWPIIGIDCEDGQHAWPGLTPSIGIGKNEPWPKHPQPPKSEDDNLPKKLIGTLNAIFDNPFFGETDEVCIVESDGFFLNKPPRHPGGIVGTLAAWCPPEWDCGDAMCVHTPWWFDRESAFRTIQVGTEIIKSHRCVSGSPDIFLGQIIQESKLEFYPSHTWSCNGGGLFNPPSNMAGALKAVRDGAWYVHGVRTKAELDELLEARPK